jgi:hypothetical protein
MMIRESSAHKCN